MVLDDIRRTYEVSADCCIHNWREMNKNDLINAAVDHADDKVLYNAYVSAIMCRYWYLINKFYYQNSSSTTAEEVYGWLIDSVLYALDCKQWRNPAKAIYGDPNGPDKVINRCMASARLMFYTASNCDKRKVNYETCSADMLQEEVGDAAFPAVEDPMFEDTIDISYDLVQQAFKRGEYFHCVVIDTIAHKVTYDITKENGLTYTEFNPRKLARELRKCDETYCISFGQRYHVNTEELIPVATKIKNYSSDKMYRWIGISIKKLANSKILKEAMS